MSGDLLKLMALDADDLMAISARVQDSVTSPARMKFDPKSKSFLVEMNRFAWENAKPKGIWPFSRKADERRNAILHVARVQNVASQGVQQSNQDDILNLLAVTFQETNSPSGILELIFAGEKSLRLDVECLELQLTDIGGVWQAQARPNHRI